MIPRLTLVGSIIHHPRHPLLLPLLCVCSYEKAKADLAKGLSHLETYLAAGEKEYLVGSQVTLADIVVASTVLYPFKLVADRAYLKPFPAVVQWFQRCVGQAEFQQVIGQVTLCKKELTAPGQS